jgi:predicted mannosyl-3-phosphoglycerate phosphatase (HAD superfamily)
MRPKDAELARAREFDEPFYFTSADEKAIARFVEIARERGFDARKGPTFWHLSSKCDPARAVRTLSSLFREATHIKLRLMGIGGGEQDLPWLRILDHAILLPPSRSTSTAPEPPFENHPRSAAITMGEIPGPPGWNQAILDIIGQS